MGSALLIGFVIHGLLACLQLEPFLRHGIAFKLRWVTMPVEIFPLGLGIAISGNVHQASPWGIVIGMLSQWTAAGIIWYFLRVLIAQRSAEPKPLP